MALLHAFREQFTRALWMRAHAPPLRFGSRAEVILNNTMLAIRYEMEVKQGVADYRSEIQQRCRDLFSRHHNTIQKMCRS